MSRPVDADIRLRFATRLQTLLTRCRALQSTAPLAVTEPLSAALERLEGDIATFTETVQQHATHAAWQRVLERRVRARPTVGPLVPGDG
jgi:hypothetical protein